MKILPIVILSTCLILVAAIEIEKKSTKIDELDVISVPDIDGDSPKSKEAQRKRDSGYSYDRPVRLTSPLRHEIIRGRVLAKRPNGGTSRPFEHYGPPNFRNQPLRFPNHNRQQHQQQQQQQQQGVKLSEFKSVPGRGQSQQDPPNHTRDYEFVEPSPIAAQNNVPFNSNAANYLPPRNQKLPYVNREQSNREQSPNHQIPTGRQPQTLNHQSQNLLRESFGDQQQISDGAIFLSQNSQAISQLYETPATNLNYEPLAESALSQNSAFGTTDSANPVQESNRENLNFPLNLPSYASGFLESREAAIRDVQSLEKDRLIIQLQRALINAQSSTEFPSTTSVSSVRYAQNHVNPNYIQNENHQGYQDAINPSSIGPQLDRPKNQDERRFYGPGFGFVPSNHVPEYTYGLPTSTPTNLDLTTTTLAASTPSSSPTQQPNVISASGQASSQVPSSITPISSTPNHLPQFGFVPSLIGATFVSGYPTYATNFITPGSSTVNQVGSSAPTHFGIPIPSLVPGQTTHPSNPGLFGNTDGSSGHQPTMGTSAQPIQPIRPLQPIRPIQPILPIAPVHNGFNVVPAVTQIQPIQTVPGPPTIGHPTYGLQPVVGNPIVAKPIKAVYPVYYYPHIYQIQKSATAPWSYAPAFSQSRQAEIWK